MTEEVEDFIEEINTLLDNEKYKFASETLIGIRTTVTERDVVTVNQRRAISNIRASKEPQANTPKWSRRYEGL